MTKGYHPCIVCAVVTIYFVGDVYRALVCYQQDGEHERPMLGGNDVCCARGRWQPSTTDAISVTLLGRDKLPNADPL